MEKHFNVLILASPVPTARFSGIARFARENGWFLTIEDRHCPPADWEGDGVLVMLSSENEALAEAVQRYRRRKIPVVDMKLARPDISLPRVTGDSAAMGRQAALRLIDRIDHPNTAISDPVLIPATLVEGESMGYCTENRR